MRTELEDQADDVRVLLETARVPESRADLARAVAAGTTVRRRRRYAAVAAATVVALTGAAGASQALSALGSDQVDSPVGEAVTGTPAPFSACTVRVLEPPGERGTLRGRVAADPTGRYAVGGVLTPAGRTEVVLWTDGTPQLLKVPALAAEATAVNSAGTVVGTAAAVEGGEQFAWVLRGGKLQKLASVPKADAVTPAAINERGDVVGQAWIGERSVAVRWPADGRAVVLDAPATARALGIAGDGTVVGTVGEYALPYAWGPDGKGRGLALPEGSVAGRALAVRGQWAAGWVAVPQAPGAPAVTTPPSVSYQDLDPLGAEGARRMAFVKPGNLVMPARWNLATGEITTWPNQTEPAPAVNAEGWVVLPSADGAGAAQVARDGDPVALPLSETGYPFTISDDARRLYGIRTSAPTPEATGNKLLRDKQLGTAEVLAWSC